MFNNRPHSCHHRTGSLLTALVAFCLLFHTGTTHAHGCDKAGDCIVLAWLPFWDQKNSFQSYRQNHSAISHVSFFWYHLDADSNIRKYKSARIDTALIKEVQENNDKAYALVANLPDANPGDPDSNWNRQRVRYLLADEDRMQRHIRDLVDLAEQHNFDGINIDYENLRRDDRTLYTNFIEKLSGALHRADKELVIALHPKTAEYKPSEDNGSHAQDWVALSAHADQLHIMGYGQHYIGSKPGPIAGVKWVEDILHYLQSLDVDEDKFVLGLPLYAQKWQIDENRSTGVQRELNYHRVEGLLKKYDVEPTYIEKSASNKMEFTDHNNNRHIVYFENGTSALAKIDMAQRHGVHNFAFWRLGGEDKALWPLLYGYRIQ